MLFHLHHVGHKPTPDGQVERYAYRLVRIEAVTVLLKVHYKGTPIQVNPRRYVRLYLWMHRKKQITGPLARLGKVMGYKPLTKERSG